MESPFRCNRNVILTNAIKPVHRFIGMISFIFSHSVNVCKIKEFTMQYAEAPCTVLAVKDRLLGHNPLAAIYNIDHYYRCLM